MLKYMPSLKVAELLLLLLTSHLAAAVYQPPSKASLSAVDHMLDAYYCVSYQQAAPAKHETAR